MSILMSEHKSIDTTAQICCYEYQLGLLDYGKNHNHKYFGQYWDHDYFHDLTRLLIDFLKHAFIELVFLIVDFL